MTPETDDGAPRAQIAGIAVARVNKIEVLPSWDEQPSFEEILGMAPNATGGLPCEEFVSNIRSAWH